MARLLPSARNQRVWPDASRGPQRGARLLDKCAPNLALPHAQPRGRGGPGRALPACQVPHLARCRRRTSAPRAACMARSGGRKRSQAGGAFCAPGRPATARPGPGSDPLGTGSNATSSETPKPTAHAYYRGAWSLVPSLPRLGLPRACLCLACSVCSSVPASRAMQHACMLVRYAQRGS